MVALAPATHLGYSQVKLVLLMLFFAFEEESVFHKNAQIWTLCDQCQRVALIPRALHLEVASELV